MAKTAKKPASPKRRRSSSVPGSYRGLSYQGTRFLFHLLQAPTGSFVCLEVFADVGVTSPSGVRTAEENKSYLSKNPLATRAPSFWNSLRNWVRQVEDGEIDAAKTAFVLCAPGATPCEIASTFHAAKTHQDAIDAVTFARKTLTRTPVQRGTKHSAIEYVFSRLDAFYKVIAQFTIETPPIDVDEVKPLFLKKLVSEDAYDNVVRWAHGWVKKTVDAQLVASKPARVAVDEFHAALLNYVRSHDRINILQSFAGIPESSEVQSELAVRYYVRQLRLIDIEDVAILEAVNDYLRAMIDRTMWADRGIVSNSALDNFAGDLTSTWRNIRRKTNLSHSEKAEQIRGQLLYSECVEHRATLDGYPPPNHFVKGSFHALSDDCAIGWHPQFEKLMPKSGSIPEGNGGK